jgi:cytochrome P450
MPTHHSDSLLLDPHFVRDPFPKLAELRNSDPVYWDPILETWFVTRHADVRQFLADPRLTNDRRVAPDYVEPEPGTWLAHFEQQSILNASPKEHRRWRSRVSAGFTPRSIRRMEAQVRDVVEAFAAPLRGRHGPVDLLALFTSPIPNTVIGRITGIPPYPGDEERFRILAQDMMRRYVFFADEANVRRGEAAINELAEWVFKLADERRSAPREDLLSDLIEGNHGDDAMSNFEIVVLVAGLVAAGSETTTLGGSQVLRHLLTHPEQLALLREAPELAPNAVREAIRFDFGSLAAVNSRFALEDIEIHGKVIRRGAPVMLSPASANRDSEIFAEPDRFDITRDTREALSFGQGPHYCLGANLAMQEMTCMLEAALEFLPPDARLISGAEDWEQIGIMRRPLRFVIDFGG